MVSWRFDYRVGLNAHLSPTTSLIHGFGHSPSLSSNLEGCAMGLVTSCLSFPIRTKGIVERKARVGASPFPTASPNIHPGRLDVCGVASVGSRDGLSPTSRSAWRDRNWDADEPFSHQIMQKGLTLSLCQAPHGAGSEGVSLRIPPPPTEPTLSPPSPACMALYCPRGPRLNPLERAGRSIARHCHRTPPTLLVPAVCPPSCRAMPSCHSMLLFHAAEPLPQPHPDPRRIGKEQGEMWFSFFSGTARPELSHCHADLLFPGRIMSFTSAHLATEVGKK